MPLGEIVREALKSQAAAKQRTILALVGIVIGIGSVIALVTVGEMVQLTSEQQFRQMGTNIITIQPGYGSPQGGNNQADSQPRQITWAEAQGLSRKVAGLEAVAPYTNAWGRPLMDDKPLDMPLLGVTGSFADINKLTLAKGRFVSDLDGYAFFGVLGAGAAAKLARMGIKEPLGKTVYFKNRGFKIIGVLKRVDEGGMRPFEINPGMMIPLQTSFCSSRSATSTRSWPASNPKPIATG